MLKTVIFFTPSGFFQRFYPALPFQTVFLVVLTLTPLFPLIVPNFVMFLKILDRKFNEDSKNVLKTVIFLLQVGFTGDFILDCPFKLCFCQFKL